MPKDSRWPIWLGMALLVTFNFVFEISKQIFTPSSQAKHEINLHEVATGNLSTRKTIKAAGLGITACCAFYLFSQYNTRSNFRNDTELLRILGVMALGMSVMVLYGVWEFRTLWKKMGEDELDELGTATCEEKPPVLRLHWVFRAAGLLTATLFLA